MRRLIALDGLRGVAACVVMLYHLTLVARPFLDTRSTGDAWWWLTQTPVKVLTAGTESVLVFFVLSGLVVALPALREGFGWAQFYAGRLLRLYLPVWGALALSVALVFLLPRDPGAVTANSWSSDANLTAIPPLQLLSEASLTRVSYDVDNVLWSLRWELVFSVLLPVFVGLALLLRRFWLPAAILATAASIAGRVLDLDALVYLPVFFLGTLMAVHLDALRAWAAERRRGLWAWILGASLLLIVLSWLARSFIPAGTAPSAFLWGFASLGAAGLILVAIGSDAVRRLLSARVPRWLGRISFSLYLVHVPVIATIAYLVGDRNWWLVALAGIPLALLTAWGFYWAIERPSHRLARRVGAIFAPRPAREAAPTGG